MRKLKAITIAVAMAGVMGSAMAFPPNDDPASLPWTGGGTQVKFVDMTHEWVKTTAVDGKCYGGLIYIDNSTGQYPSKWSETCDALCPAWSGDTSLGQVTVCNPEANPSGASNQYHNGSGPACSGQVADAQSALLAPTPYVLPETSEQDCIVPPSS